MSVTVYIPSSLRSLTANQARLQVSARDIATGQVRGTPRGLFLANRGVELNVVIDKVTAALELRNLNLERSSVSLRVPYLLGDHAPKYGCSMFLRRSLPCSFQATVEAIVRTVQ